MSNINTNASQGENEIHNLPNQVVAGANVENAAIENPAETGPGLPNAQAPPLAGEAPPQEQAGVNPANAAAPGPLLPGNILGPALAPGPAPDPAGDPAPDFAPDLNPALPNEQDDVASPLSKALGGIPGIPSDKSH
ncbi:hypothetical protein FRC07_009104 [Ceratobasidium sp. 392]|nr:hypothetical protein FRC07_009104 [Ceratobasidium sp. 392]